MAGSSEVYENLSLTLDALGATGLVLPLEIKVRYTVWTTRGWLAYFVQ